MTAQDTGKHGVESSDPHISRGIPDQGIDTFPHLICGLVGERDGKDIRRPDPPHTDQIRDTVCDHARFSRAGAGQDQKRALVMQDRLPLFIIQFFEQVVHPCLLVPLRKAKGVLSFRVSLYCICCPFTRTAKGA